MTEKMMNKVMLECIRIARQNMDDDQYPIGAIITDDRGKIISSSRSSLRKELDPTNHPEIAAIRKASKILKRRKLKKCYLFTTLEPCPMCTSAAIWACMEEQVRRKQSNLLKNIQNINCRGDKFL